MNLLKEGLIGSLLAIIFGRSKHANRSYPIVGRFGHWLLKRKLKKMGLG